MEIVNFQTEGWKKASAHSSSQREGTFSHLILLLLFSKSFLPVKFGIVSDNQKKSSGIKLLNGECYSALNLGHRGLRRKQELRDLDKHVCNGIYLISNPCRGLFPLFSYVLACECRKYHFCVTLQYSYHFFSVDIPSVSKNVPVILISLTSAQAKAVHMCCNVHKMQLFFRFDQGLAETDCSAGMCHWALQSPSVWATQRRGERSGRWAGWWSAY